MWNVGGEKIVQSGSLNNLTWYNTNFTVPAGAYLGCTTMRVREVYLGTNIDPCTPAMYGETEDYIVCILSGTTSIAEIKNELSLSIYPNPVSNGDLTIDYSLLQNQGGAFKIYDVTGKAVFENTLLPNSNRQHFKLPELSNGIYYGAITSGNQTVNRKIAVIKE